MTGIVVSPGYSSGSYTPTITFATPGDLSVSYATQVGRYQIIGDTVAIWTNVTFTPTFTTASGVFHISLPFAAAAGAVQSISVGSLPTAAAWPASVAFVNAQAAPGASYAVLAGYVSGASVSYFQTAQFPSGSAATVILTGIYYLR